MHAAQRQKLIMTMIEERGAVQVTELSDTFGVSEVTIRSDLRQLEQTGNVQRTFGGALLKEKAEFPFPYMSMLLSDKKTAIAKAATALIREGDSLILDASSTSWHLALQIKEWKNLTVISNSIPVFELFKTYTDGDLIGIPGILNPYSQSFVGPMAEQAIAGLKASKAFITPKSIVPDGLRDHNLLDAALRGRMMESAAETIVLADHSKFSGNRQLYGIADWENVSTLITDREPDESYIRLLRDHHVKLIVAGE